MPAGADDLFAAALNERLAQQAPLAARMRPRSLDEVVGQDHLLGPGNPLRALIEADRLSSVILWGPPGTGKTTLAHLIAGVTERAFVAMSAVTAGVKDVREVIGQARRTLGEHGRGTILFLDEVHRFNKAQQDALLPAVEDGTLTLIGATTENPYFEVNAPLLSRSTLFRLEPLGSDALGLAPGRTITLADIEAARSTRALRYEEDDHYDVISAFIKSIRGSDPDAGLYWLARMLSAGEDARFIARRLVILASEDIGMADPMSLVVADAAARAVEFVGLPEAQLNLAQAVVHLATAPKSNRAAVGIWNALGDVKNRPAGPVPAHLRDSHYRSAKKLGHGVG